MRYAIIVSGTVTNVIEAEAGFATAYATQVGGTAVATTAAGLGDAYADGTFTPHAVVLPVPAEVTMRQARLALLGAGLLDGVETAINAMTEPAKTKARVEWDYSNTLRRDHPLVATLGTGLGLTGEQLDGLFRAAAVL